MRQPWVLLTSVSKEAPRRGYVASSRDKAGRQPSASAAAAVAARVLPQRPSVRLAASAVRQAEEGHDKARADAADGARVAAETRQTGRNATARHSRRARVAAETRQTGRNATARHSQRKLYRCGVAQPTEAIPSAADRVDALQCRRTTLGSCVKPQQTRHCEALPSRCSVLKQTRTREASAAW